MKLLRLIFSLVIAGLTLVFFSTCKKNNNDSWTAEEKASYNNVIAIQDQAADNYTTWMQTMDSLDVINQLQQFFLSNPSVISATIGSQGIMVEYANGMGGGIFLNPRDNPGYDSLNLKSLKNDRIADIKSQPLVNIKEAILLNPHYWDRIGWTDKIIANYNQYLPMAGYNLARTYFNHEADVDQFTKLSGYGIIHIYTHGLAWPSPSNIQAVYLLTGEEENEDTSEDYWEELRNKEILIIKTDASEFRIENVYFISEKFIEGHNDFSQDTILFFGGFCFSSLCDWSELPNSFAAGTYLGFDGAVFSSYCNKWANDLIKTLADTTSGNPNSVVDWLASPLDKSYLDDEYDVVVSIQAFGDALLLWKNPPPDVETITASSVTGSAATLNAAINPQGSTTTAMFEYGLTTDYGLTAAITQNHLTGKDWIDVHADISGLLSNSTYHYRIKATCNSGISLGEDMTFATSTLPPYLESKDYGLYIGMLNSWLCPDSASAGQYIYFPRYFNSSGDYIKCTSNGSGNISINWTADSETCTGSGTVMPHHIEMDGWMPVNYYSFNIAFEYNYQGPLSYKYTGSITGIGHLDTYFTSRQLDCSGTMTLNWTDWNGDPQECSYPKSFTNQSDLHDFGK